MIRAVLIRIALVSVVLLVSLKIGDLGVGLILDFSSHVETRRHIPLREPPPRYELIDSAGSASSGQALKPVAYRVDGDGFLIGPTGSGSTVDMMFVGGSTTECANVDEELRFPALVSRLLARRGGGAPRTLNAGYAGNHLMHSLNVILAKGLPYKPRLVFVMEAINDLVHLQYAGSYWAGPPSRALVANSHPASSFPVTIKDLLIPNSFELMRPFIGRHFVPSLTDDFAEYRGRDVDNDRFDEASRQFESALKTIAFSIRAWGSSPVLMTQFNRIQVDDPVTRAGTGMSGADYNVFVHRYAAFNDIIRRVAREHSIQLIDLERQIPHSADYMMDEVHLTDEGSKLVARIIAEYISAHFPEYVAAGIEQSFSHSP